MKKNKKDLQSNLIIQDVSKLHAEINQAVNHRFLLTAGAITAFALISKNIVQTLPNENLGYMVNIVSYFAYLSVLALLFYQSLGIRVIIRTNSTYLRTKKLSVWEEDWSNFRAKTKKYGGVLSNADLIAHGSIFIGLSLFSLVFGSFLLCVLCKSIGITDYAGITFLVFLMVPSVGFIYFFLSGVFQFFILALYALFGIRLISVFIGPSLLNGMPPIVFIFVSLCVNLWLMCWFILRIYRPAYDEDKLLSMWEENL